MVDKLSVLVPWLLLCYILFRFHRTPLFLTALPLVFSLGEAGFIKAWGFSIVIPYFLTLNFGDCSVVLLIIAWIYASRRGVTFNKSSKISIYFILKFYILVLLLYVPLAWIKDSQFTFGTILQLRQFLNVPISVFIWLSIFRHCTIGNLYTLFDSLMRITLIGAVFYSLTSVGIPIYQNSYQSIGLGFGSIHRDFLSFPPYIGIVLGYVLFSNKPTKNINLFILFIAALLSYTRSIIGAFVLVVFTSQLLRRDKLTSKFLLLIMIPVVLVSSYLFISNFAPTNSEFLVDRFSEFKSSALPNNAEARLEGFSYIHEYLSEFSLLTGVGLSMQNSSSLSTLDIKGVVLGDTLWNLVLYRLGYLGIVMLAIILLTILYYSISVLFISNLSSSAVFLKLSSVASIYMILITSAGSFFLMYPVITGLIIATTIFTYSSARLRNDTTSNWKIVRGKA